MANNNGNGNGTLVLAKGLFRRRNDDGFMRRKVTDVLLKDGPSSTISKFKLEPQFHPDKKVVRKILGACSTCCPSRSKIDDLIDEDMKRAGVWNLFDVVTKNSHQPFFKQKFAGVYFVWEVAPSSEKQIVKLSQKEILEEAYLKLGTSEEDKRTKAELQKVAESCPLPFTGVSGWPVIFRLTGFIIRKLSQLLWEKVCVHEGELELVKHAHRCDSPIIYFPLNRSDLDPFVLFMTLLSAGLPVPYFFSTKSQRYWGKFIGGIGHNELPKNSSRRSQDIWKKACFINILKKRASVCLSLESQRTRSGKPSLELYSIEFLSELVENFGSHEVEDAWIVPFCVSHEVVPEHFDRPAFTKCNTGISVFRKLKNYLFKNLGIARVTFGQPFTLRELKRAFTETGACYNSESCMKTFLGSELPWGSANHSALSASLSSMNDIDLDDFNSSQDNFAYFPDFVAFHGFFESARAAVPMSTHLVAFILTKKFRHYGVSFPELCSEVENMKSWLRLYDKDVGFSGDVTKIVCHALNLLGPDLIEIEFSNNGKGVPSTIRPILSQDSLGRLGYYANGFACIFALEGVAATAVFQLVGNNLKVSRGIVDGEVKISSLALTKESRSIYRVLSYEFFFHPPCTTFDAAFYQTCDHLKDRDILYTVMKEAGAGPSRRCYDSDDYDSEEDPSSSQAFTGGFVPQDYELCNTEESFSTLQLLSQIITPYLEIYAALVVELKCLIPVANIDATSDVCDFELIDILLSSVRAKFQVQDYGEYLTYETVKAALATFESHGIVVYKVASKGNIVMLAEEFESTESLRQFANDMLRFVTY